MTENDLYTNLNFIFATVLGWKDKLGSHTGRKSGYLRAFLAGITNVMTIMLAADHECLIVAKRYVKDSMAIASVNNVFNVPRQQVGTWYSPYCAGNETAARACAPGAQWQKPIVQLVKGFMEDVVKINPTDPRCNQPKFIYKQVTDWRRPGSNPKADLKKHLNSVGVNENRQATIMRCIYQMQNEEVDKNKRTAESKQMIAQAGLKGFLLDNGFDAKKVEDLNVASYFEKAGAGSVMLPPMEIPIQDTTAVQVGPPPAKKQRLNSRGTKVIMNRDLRKLNAKDTVEKMAFIVENADTNISEYDDGSRQWLMRCNPIAKCFTKCCDRDLAVFLEKHASGDKDFSVTKVSKSKMVGCQGCASGG